MANNPETPPTGSPEVSQASKSVKWADRYYTFLLFFFFIPLGGGYLYRDNIAKPGVNAASIKLSNLRAGSIHEVRAQIATKESKAGRIAGAASPEKSLPQEYTSVDIQKILGMSPTWVEYDGNSGSTSEYYCWWGKLPFLSKKFDCLVVEYMGEDPRIYRSHSIR